MSTIFALRHWNCQDCPKWWHFCPIFPARGSQGASFFRPVIVQKTCFLHRDSWRGRWWKLIHKIVFISRGYRKLDPKCPRIKLVGMIWRVPQKPLHSSLASPFQVQAMSFPMAWRATWKADPIWRMGCSDESHRFAKKGFQTLVTWALLQCVAMTLVMSTAMP